MKDNFKVKPNKKNGTFKNNVRMKWKKPNLPSLAAINLVYNTKAENKFLYIYYIKTLF